MQRAQKALPRLPWFARIFDMSAIHRFLLFDGQIFLECN